MIFVSLSTCLDFIDSVMCGLGSSANSRCSLPFNTGASTSFFYVGEITGVSGHLVVERRRLISFSLVGRVGYWIKKYPQIPIGSET